MMFLNRLLSPMQHCEDATAHLLKALNIKYTNLHLQKELAEHPNYPSLISIADVIGQSYDVACLPYKIPAVSILKEPAIKTPFLAQIKNNGASHEVFAVITQFSERLIELYNPGLKKQQSLDIEAFNKIYSGTLLLVGAGNLDKEKGYDNHLKEEKRKKSHNNIALLIIPAIALFFCLKYITGINFMAAIAPMSFLLVTLIGCIITAVLLWYEIDEYNPVVKQICQASAKVNCSAILHSKASKIMGLSWSSLGFTYFAGLLLYLMISSLQFSALAVAGWLTILAIPYTIFSLYFKRYGLCFCGNACADAGFTKSKR